MMIISWRHECGNLRKIENDYGRTGVYKIEISEEENERDSGRVES